MKTVVDYCREAAERYPDSPAVIEGTQSWSHAELFERVDRLSSGLTTLGLQKADVVLAWLPNAHHAIESELACLQSGGIWVTLHGDMTWPEVMGVIASTDPKILIVGKRQYERLNLDAPTLSKREFQVVLVDDAFTSTESVSAYEGLLGAHDAARPNVTLGPSDLARLRYTSGTTGSAKAAMLTHDVYLASLEVQQRQLHDLDSTDRVMHAAPLTHASGALIYPLLAAGGANIILPRFDAEEALATIEKQRVTTMFCVPTILHRLTQAEGFHTRDLSSLKTVTYGGAPAVVENLKPFMERLPGVLVQIFGLTEALHPATTLKRDEHYADNPHLRSVGQPTHICEMRVADEDRVDLPDGEVGEILIRGRNVMAGYWRDEEATELVLRDGWLATGDLGYRDAEGYFYIVDRKKDVIITGGFNVYTSEVERILGDHSALDEVAVFGIPHDEWGESVHAVVTSSLDPLPTEGDLRAYCAEFLSKFKIPKSIDVQSEPLPKSGAGKIVKTDLRQAHWEGYERRIH